jgi:hypothetical protein
MLRHVLVAISLLGAVGAASAAPLSLSDQQLDTVTAGRVIVGANFERVFQNGEPGLLVTLTEIDTKTGEVTTRTFGRSVTIPTIPTISLNLTITSGR